MLFARQVIRRCYSECYQHTSTEIRRQRYNLGSPHDTWECAYGWGRAFGGELCVNINSMHTLACNDSYRSPSAVLCLLLLLSLCPLFPASYTYQSNGDTSRRSPVVVSICGRQELACNYEPIHSRLLSSFPRIWIMLRCLSGCCSLFLHPICQLYFPLIFPTLYSASELIALNAQWYMQLEF